MQFCDECGSMMRKEDGVMVCSSCGYSEAQDEDLAEAFVSTDAQDTSDVVESDPESGDEGKPTAEVECDACGNGTAWYTIKQTGSADEPPTRFFKCTECGHRWRSYS
ncbi:transcription factor S [Salarchaeum sp. JOR-1]|uniref:transcription factor S n=1 Tax=Salarchaeum sp. JOR-1 TaxID=2599399 RepID=UPI0011989D8C|nr:transcription factor S [Salarchaeum sp. JOR-1]QDX40617.1 transcription factor S [Salarchaeum sp. JOR-1]